MSTFHLALPLGLDGRNTRNWIVVEQVRPGVFAKTNSTRRYRPSDFKKIIDRDITESITSLVKELSIYKEIANGRKESEEK